MESGDRIKCWSQLPIDSHSGFLLFLLDQTIQKNREHHYFFAFCHFFQIPPSRHALFFCHILPSSHIYNSPSPSPRVRQDPPHGPLPPLFGSGFSKIGDTPPGGGGAARQLAGNQTSPAFSQLRRFFFPALIVFHTFDELCAKKRGICQLCITYTILFLGYYIRFDLPPLGYFYSICIIFDFFS